MTAFIEKLAESLTDPVTLYGHFTYFLLIASMLARRMVRLRMLAVASGLAKIVYRAFFVIDPISVFWEAIFVLVNVVQLAIIWYYEYHHRFSEEHDHFARNMPAGVERSAVKRLLELSDLRRFEPGEALTREHQPVTSLMYIADGVVQIESGDRVVAVCGPGDYVGELSFLSGKPASATATVVKTVSVLAFDQARLNRAIEADPVLRRTLESTLNRNLAGKLHRSNAPGLAPGQGLAG